MTNEHLCSLARKEDKAAEAALIENVLPSGSLPQKSKNGIPASCSKKMTWYRKP